MSSTAKKDSPSGAPGDADSADSTGSSHLRRVIEHAAHLLPAQGPITAFVHHNTLHAFEDLPFDEAVIRGGETLGCHPYLPEQSHRKELARGRILRDDIEAVLIDELGDRADELLGFLGTRFHLRMSMVEYPWRTGPAAELRWLVAETDALKQFRHETSRPRRDRVIGETRRWVMRDLLSESVRTDEKARIGEVMGRLFERFDKNSVEQWSDATWEAFCLHMLWIACRDGVKKVTVADDERVSAVRHRDLLLEATGEDSDRLVNDLLIRFSATFLDQGFGRWVLPDRDTGFFRSFLALYGRPFGPPDRWLRGLAAEATRIERNGTSPLASIVESLQDLGVDPAEWDEFITQTLLSLRGYAGMIWQLETRGDRVAHPAPQDSLIEFLAVRLILERLAITHLARTTQDYREPLHELRKAFESKVPRHGHAGVDQRAFLVFQLAQLQGWTPELLFRLSDDEWQMLIDEIEAFSSLERRHIYHLAFERHYRIQTLDAIAAHSVRRRERNVAASPAAEPSAQPSSSDDAPGTGRDIPRFQVVCCIDEREESFRRHLEEVAEDCETFGAAGFFAIAMYYRGAADAHYTPLCPVIIQPKHYVRENVVYSFGQSDRRRRKRRRTIGTVTHQVHLGSRTFAGGWLAGVLGPVASIPLVTRILFPRATAQLRRVMGGFVRPPAVTKLQLERSEELPGQDNGHIGYSLEEMATLVECLLRDIGLTHDLSRLIIICGHGSSSLNNPHESAHDCGACGGGRGGPNARAFAQMANNPAVRNLIAENGLELPQTTVFIGAYHNTCDDSLSYYDLHLLAPTHQDDFESASRAMDEARKRSAGERCRRFETAELSLTPDAALRHVEGRAEDLSQVRPEYGHASNALCLVGQRDWSRGLFLDRRAFLQSYDPRQDDDEHTILTRILQAVIPVCAGINLEYYFSYVDPIGYGCGTKLPHNITALLGVMNGAASDLRPGLPWQMVEIHEPMRLLFVIETTPDAILQIMDRNPGIDKLIRGNWVQLATLDSETLKINRFCRGRFEPYRPSSDALPKVGSSIAWFRGWRDHLGFASISDPTSDQLDNLASSPTESGRRPAHRPVVED